MEEFFRWVKDNAVLSGSGAALIGLAGFFFRKFIGTSTPPKSLAPAIANTMQASPVITNNINTTLYGSSQGEGRNDGGGSLRGKMEKGLIKILFVDDDTRFQVVRMMKSAGWQNVKITKDIKDLAAPEVAEAQIFFVDIQGVGKALGFFDEGLGLALELKKKYPEKKVVIYSAQTDGDRFHKALNKADGSLSKNAEPYQFIALVEELLEAP
jgi:hypothetical protein